MRTISATVTVDGSLNSGIQLTNADTGEVLYWEKLAPIEQRKVCNALAGFYDLFSRNMKK